MFSYVFELSFVGQLKKLTLPSNALEFFIFALEILSLYQFLSLTFRLANFVKAKAKKIVYSLNTTSHHYIKRSFILINKSCKSCF